MYQFSGKEGLDFCQYMSAVSMMEMNTKAPFVWDWESLVMFPSRTVEAPRKFQVVDSEFQSMEGFDGGSYGGKSEGLSGGSVSDLAYGSSSKSSKSASLESSSNREAMRESSKFTLEASDGFSHDLSYRKELLIGAWPPNTIIAGDLRASDVGDISIGSGESLIGLKLGKRTYFEDVAANGHTKASVMDSVPGSVSYDALGKRSKVSSIEIPHCQVEGCNLDLSSAKDYHRKHRVCENHSKSPKVVICGVERRFCQQCSRFHSLAEFDQKKRSCRRRLSDHNARRRKPKPEVIQFNPMRLASSLHEGTNHMSLGFNKVPPPFPPRPSATSMWDFTSNNSKLTDQEEKLRLFSTVKAEGGGVGELQHSTQNKLQDTGFKLSYDSSSFLPTSKESAPPPAQLFHQGLWVPVAATSNSKNMEAATQDDLRALSLLSTNSWGVSSGDPQLHANYWQGYKQPSLLQTAATPVQVLDGGDGNNHFQEFQLFKAPSESGFYHY